MEEEVKVIGTGGGEEGVDVCAVLVVATLVDILEHWVPPSLTIVVVLFQHCSRHLAIECDVDVLVRTF